MESLVITLREGVEASLVFAIIISYLRRTGRDPLIGRVWWGLGMAIVASVGAAFVLPRLFRTVLDEETYEGVLMLAAGVMVLSLVIWMAWAGREIGKRIEEKVETISSGAWAAWGVLLFAFLMIFREGAEVVLLLTALDVGTDSILQLMGGLGGIALAVVFGIGFVKGSARVDLRSFFRVTGALLLVLALLLLIGGVHEFGEAGIIPVGPRQMAMIGPIVHNNAYVFSVILVGTAALVLLGRREDPSPAEWGQAQGVAAQRRRAWITRVERRWRIVLTGMAVVFVVLLTGFHIYSSAPGMEPASLIRDNGGRIRIPLADLEDGRMRFYVHMQGDESVRFFAVRMGADRYEVCLDACLICGPKGYYQRGPELICRNCAAPINPASLGLPGGCNPIPVASEIDGDQIVFRAVDLHATADY